MYVQFQFRRTSETLPGDHGSRLPHLPHVSNPLGPRGWAPYRPEGSPLVDRGRGVNDQSVLQAAALLRMQQQTPPPDLTAGSRQWHGRRGLLDARGLHHSQRNPDPARRSATSLNDATRRPYLPSTRSPPWIQYRGAKRRHQFALAGSLL
jgi:hypothetical protein